MVELKVISKKRLNCFAKKVWLAATVDRAAAEGLTGVYVNGNAAAVVG